jgi:hypothetical protein
MVRGCGWYVSTRGKLSELEALRKLPGISFCANYVYNIETRFAVDLNLLTGQK